MKAITSKVLKGITMGTSLVCADNSGAKMLEVIGILGVGGRKRRIASAGVGDIVIVSVKKGSVKIRKTKQKAIIVRQKTAIRRGKIRVKFEDNAAVIIDDSKLLKGSEIKGCIAREIAELYPKLAGQASSVV